MYKNTVKIEAIINSNALIEHMPRTHYHNNSVYACAQCKCVKNYVLQRAAVTRSIDSILDFTSRFIENGIDRWIGAIEPSEWANEPHLFIWFTCEWNCISLFIYDLFACMTMNLNAVQSALCAIPCRDMPHDIQYGFPMQLHKLNVIYSQFQSLFSELKSIKL